MYEIETQIMQVSDLRVTVTCHIINLILDSAIWFANSSDIRAVGWEYGPQPLGPKERDGLIVPPGKA